MTNVISGAVLCLNDIIVYAYKVRHCHGTHSSLCARVQVGIEPEDVNAEVLPSHKRSQVMAYQKGKTKVYNACCLLHCTL